MYEYSNLKPSCILSCWPSTFLHLPSTSLPFPLNYCLSLFLSCHLPHINCYSVRRGRVASAPHLSVAHCGYAWSDAWTNSQPSQSTCRMPRNDTAFRRCGFADVGSDQICHRTHGHRTSKRTAALQYASSRAT